MLTCPLLSCTGFIQYTIIYLFREVFWKCTNNKKQFIIGNVLTSDSEWCMTLQIQAENSLCAGKYFVIIIYM